MINTIHSFEFEGRTITLRQTCEGVTAIDGDLVVVFRGARLKVEDQIVDVHLPAYASTKRTPWLAKRGKA